MALVPFTARTEGDITLSAGVAKTIVQIVAPANQRIDTRAASVTFKGTSPTETPILVELVHQNTAGTSVAGTPRRDSAGSETLQTTSRITITAEPALDYVMREWLFHPQGGFLEKFSVGEIQLEGGARLGLRVTSPQAATCRGFISGEE